MKKLILLITALLIITPPSFAKSKLKGWKEHRTVHFRIYYDKAPRDFVETIEEFAERYYKEIVQDLGFVRYKNWTYDERAKIYIYNNRDDYVKRARLMNWSHGAARAKTREIWTFPAAHGFFDTTLPHELTHIIFREIVGFKSNVPLWLDEGVAMYMEKARRFGSHQDVIKAIAAGNFVSVEDLYWLPQNRGFSNQQVLNLFYAESASLVNFMITELGEYRFERFCRELKKGQRYEMALTKVYSRFKNVDDLNKAWLKYLEKLAKSE